MLTLDTALPPGALCDAHPDAVAPALQNAHWWHGAPAYMEQDPTTGALSLWRAHTHSPPAEPTEPNNGNGQIGEVDTLYGLQCRAGVHCGVVAKDAAANAQTATVAIRFYTLPGTEARTLFTLNAAQADNYLFLSHADGTLTLKDDQNRAETHLPCPDHDAPHLAIASLHGDRLALSLNANHAHTHARDTILTGPASLFIGCRNHRPRLLKTLGSALILDVFLFPGRALLHSDASADKAALQALRRHHFWAAP